ncbi:unnamed protein product [Adineta steineri]|uniref:Deltamethrin resistance protein prag01 domain-containing protein n=1 Tax=Adineta steineri TaxID=433720 RepID=A0A814TMX8_9BILA|nr:unnamed protein product [Adineta steineri]CAF1164504.1 unnamed protein product [Adineta steineri]
MLTRIVKSNIISMTEKNMHIICITDSLRYKSHRSSSNSEVQHIDPYKARYERLWQQKATLDWLPKPEGNWQEINGKKQAYYNKILTSGVITFILSFIYLRVVIVSRSGALTKPPYHLIGNEDFPGSKYNDKN